MITITETIEDSRIEAGMTGKVLGTDESGTWIEVQVAPGEKVLYPLTAQELADWTK